ncbi:MAG: prepilin-type N-terminal cleavage/methylation domain-containing protein [Candidatus Saccharimonadales bacterium]
MSTILPSSQTSLRSGFTIVELLIVIVIIGILAAITIVAYNGIQNRARNQSMVSAASQIYKGISQYVLDNGAYPTSSNVSCVGSGYPVDSTGLCWSGQSSLSANTLLAPYMSNIPSPPMEKIGGLARGILINTSSRVLEYTITGSTTCPSIGARASAPTAFSDGSMWCRAILPDL